jgi:hypothetical protein
MSAGDGDDQAHGAGGADLLLEIKIIETRREVDRVAGLRREDGALEAGEGRPGCLPVIDVAPGPDVDEPVHAASERPNEASGQEPIAPKVSRL